MGPSIKKLVWDTTFICQLLIYSVVNVLLDISCENHWCIFIRNASLYLPHRCDIHSLTRWYNELISRGNNEKWCKLYPSLCLFLYRSCQSVACIGTRFGVFCLFYVRKISKREDPGKRESLLTKVFIKPLIWRILNHCKQK